MRWHRRPCDLAMHPFERVGSRERQGTCQHLVKRDAEGIKVATRVDRAVHPPGLFRSHVSQCSGDELGRFGSLVLAAKARSNPKTENPDVTRRGVHQNIGRLYILVNQLLFVQPGDCSCESDTEAQELRQLHRPGKEPIKGFTSRIFKYERYLSPSLRKSQRTHRPGRVQFAPQ